jgi:hypothetical protein
MVCNMVVAVHNSCLYIFLLFMYKLFIIYFKVSLVMVEFETLDIEIKCI